MKIKEIHNYVKKQNSKNLVWAIGFALELWCNTAYSIYFNLEETWVNIFTTK